MTGRAISQSAPRPAWVVLAWYCAVAGFNAILYFLLCESLTLAHWPASAASTVALLPVLLVSYLGHKKKTFRSGGLHRLEAPRFMVLSLVDLGLAAITPYLTTTAGLDVSLSFAALTALIPLANLMLMRFWVFRGA